MDPRVVAIQDWLAARILARGPIPFAEFMAAALTHPELGYYMRPGTTIGATGDFYTSPDVHPAFGLLVSRQVAEIADRCSGSDSEFELVEVGPGTGRLARDVIAGLASERPDLASRVRLTLVEVSPSLRDTQEKTLGQPGKDGRSVAGAVRTIEWHRWEDLLTRQRGAPFRGCVIANEFLDALPVHVVERRDGDLYEIHVALSDGRFEEFPVPLDDERLSRHIDRLAHSAGVALAEGQRAEFGLEGMEWIGQLGTLFGTDGHGGAILIDYGYPARELYTAGRQNGTLLCYRRHRVVEDPFEHIGDQDMTAHIDFSSVADRAREAGFDVAPLTSQMKFLVALGLAQMLAEPGTAPARAEDVRNRLALHALMAPGGMGEVFKVMMLTRGTPASELTGSIDPFSNRLAFAPGSEGTLSEAVA